MKESNMLSDKYLENLVSDQIQIEMAELVGERDRLRDLLQTAQTELHERSSLLSQIIETIQRNAPDLYNSLPQEVKEFKDQHTLQQP